jgi:hypothetical protein
MRPLNEHRHLALKRYCRGRNNFVKELCPTMFLLIKVFRIGNYHTEDETLLVPGHFLRVRRLFGLRK